MRIREVAYDHPDAQRLIAELQQEYVARYGSPDDAPVDPAEFSPPRGTFLLGYLDGAAVASGAWRVREGRELGLRHGGAELKRMYVLPQLRGHGLSRLMLAELEARAAQAGHTRVVLETGVPQPEAIALYRSTGYVEIPRFGPNRDDPLTVCFAKRL